MRSVVLSAGRAGCARLLRASVNGRDPVIALAAMPASLFEARAQGRRVLA